MVNNNPDGRDNPMSKTKSKHGLQKGHAKAISAVTWILGIVLLVIYLMDVWQTTPFDYMNFVTSLLHVVIGWPWLVLVFAVLLICAIVITSVVAKQHKATKKQPAAAKQVDRPEACVACGQPLNKGSSRCTECGYAWCLNCGAWSAPGSSHCKQCNAGLPSK